MRAYLCGKNNQPLKGDFMIYPKLVAQIKGLRWKSASVKDLHSLMILSAYAAREFAGSLRMALEEHPQDDAFGRWLPVN